MGVEVSRHFLHHTFSNKVSLPPPPGSVTRAGLGIIFVFTLLLDSNDSSIFYFPK